MEFGTQGQPQSHDQSMPQGGTQSRFQRNGPQEESLPDAVGEPRRFGDNLRARGSQPIEQGQPPVPIADRGRHVGRALPDLLSAEPIFPNFRRHLVGQQVEQPLIQSRREDRNSPVIARSQGRVPEVYRIHSPRVRPQREQEAPRSTVPDRGAARDAQQGGQRDVDDTLSYRSATSEQIRKDYAKLRR